MLLLHVVYVLIQHVTCYEYFKRMNIYKRLILLFIMWSGYISVVLKPKRKYAFIFFQILIILICNIFAFYRTLGIYMLYEHFWRFLIVCLKCCLKVLKSQLCHVPAVLSILSSTSHLQIFFFTLLLHCAFSVSDVTEIKDKNRCFVSYQRLIKTNILCLMRADGMPRNVF